MSLLDLSLVGPSREAKLLFSPFPICLIMVQSLEFLQFLKYFLISTKLWFAMWSLGPSPAGDFCPQTRSVLRSAPGSETKQPSTFSRDRLVPWSPRGLSRPKGRRWLWPLPASQRRRPTWGWAWWGWSAWGPPTTPALRWPPPRSTCKLQTSQPAVINWAT